MWNPDWKLSGAARGGPGATYLQGETLVTYPRDARPCRLERSATLSSPVVPRLTFKAGAISSHPWRLQVMVDDDVLADRAIDGEAVRTARAGEDAEPAWVEVSVDLSKYAGKTVVLRMYQWTQTSQVAASAYWRKAALQ